MREILDIILDEKMEWEKGKLLFSRDNMYLEKLELVILPGMSYEDSFRIHSPEEKHTYGYVSVSDPHIECRSTSFAGTEEVFFLVHGENLREGDCLKGEFLIRSNQGEYVFPYEVRVKGEELISSEGMVDSLNDFCNLAKRDWQEAVSLFYTQQFAEMIRQKEPQLFLCYQALSVQKRNENNLDQFLLTAGKKQRMTYFVEDSQLILENPEEAAVLSLGILKNGWGYTKLDIEADGDFIFVEKNRITDDDFLGNRYKLPIYIDCHKLHAGRNLGRVILWDLDTSVEVPVEVRITGYVTGDREADREKRRNHYKLMDVYQSFRLKEMNTAAWLKETDRLVQRMMTLDEEDIAAKLFFAQILITAERYNEAGWILEHYQEQSEEESPQLHAYYLYLTSLLRRDEAYTKQVAVRIERIYKEQGESWRAAWLLLYVSREYERSSTAKWLFLEEQFDQGCRSPLIYFEAIQLLNHNPALLRRLERFELQVINYGNKKGILSPEVLEQMYYLSGKRKEFSGLLYRILANCYEKTGDSRILGEICTMLIKGNRVEKKYYPWFKLGVEAQIRITNLYEYYMMSLDLEKEEEIPKMVLMYFTYQSHLDYAHAAYLYRYVSQSREEYPEIYESYAGRMKTFVKEQIKRQRMNGHLDSLYHMYLSEDMVEKHNAEEIIRILFSYRIKAPHCGVTKALVYQKDYENPCVYPVNGNELWLPVYGKESCVVWEDGEGNRFVQGYPLHFPHDLAEHPIVRRGAVYVENNPYLDLYLYEEGTPMQEPNAEWIARLFRIWGNERVSLPVRREVAVRIMKYYYQTEDRAHLEEYLENLPVGLLTGKEASEGIKYMVFCRMDDRAYSWLLQFGYDCVDSKIAASLVSAMIRKTDYKPDVQLLHGAFEIFKRGKYTREILDYLSMHYEGSAYQMYQVWKAAYVCDSDVRSLSERILVQMLFTDDYVEEHGEVFRKYVKDAPDDRVRFAYVIRMCINYYLENREPQQSVQEQVLNLYQEGREMPVVCELACLKYYGEYRDRLDERSLPILSQILKKQLLKGIHLPWFRQYEEARSLLQDKAILEYHGHYAGEAKFRFRLCREGAAEDNWKVIQMNPVCRNVYFTEQILFFGESVEYQILEDTGDGEMVMKSGILKAGPEECFGETRVPEGRFQTINQLLETKAVGQDELFEELLEDYLKKEYISRQIFTLL